MEELEKENRTKFNYQRRRFREIQSHHTKENLQEKNASLIQNKWNELSQIDDKTYTKLTNFLNQFPEINRHELYTDLTNYYDPIHGCSSYQINHSNSRLKTQDNVCNKIEIIPFSKYVEGFLKERSVNVNSISIHTVDWFL